MLRRAIATNSKLIRQYSTTKFPDNKATQTKPKIREFRNPLFHTFLIASSSYIILHALWVNMEYQEIEKDFNKKTKILEDRIQELVDVKRDSLKSTKWYNYIAFWK